MLLWLTLLASVAAVVLVVIGYSEIGFGKTYSVAQMGLSVVGLLPMLVVYLDLSSQVEQAGGMVSITPQIGLWGTLLGFIAVGIGGFLDWRVASTAPRAHSPRVAARFCLKCGKPLEPGAAFCAYCGASQKQY